MFFLQLLSIALPTMGMNMPATNYSLQNLLIKSQKIAQDNNAIKIPTNSILIRIDDENYSILPADLVEKISALKDYGNNNKNKNIGHPIWRIHDLFNHEIDCFKIKEQNNLPDLLLTLFTHKSNNDQIAVDKLLAALSYELKEICLKIKIHGTSINTILSQRPPLLFILKNNLPYIFVGGISIASLGALLWLFVLAKNSVTTL